MMNKKVIKTISILLMMLMVAMMLSTSVFAIGEVKSPSGFDAENGFFSTDTQTTTVFQGFIGTLINIIQVVGMGVAVIMLVVMAIKYVSAAPSEKAELKKSIMIYVVGAVVLFAASGILQVIKNFAKANINPASVSMVIDMAKIYLG